MTITDLTFFGFVLATVIVYYVCPKKFRWLVLLAASVAFYVIVCAKYIPYIIFTALSTWAGGLWMGHVSTTRKAELKSHKEDWDRATKNRFKKQTTKNKRLILVLVLLLNFGILAFLKYYAPVANWINGMAGVQSSVLDLVLPLGISFYTFQAMGYIIDVYWDKTAPQKNPLKFFLFVSFFPQIIQGPIGIYNDLAQQLYDGHALKYENIKYGFQLILWGLFKKMVIADRLVVPYNNLLALKENLGNGYSLLTVLLFAVQIYMDFSGGIDIIRGVAQMLGINMAENFKRPYFSVSVTDFWRRWHASLGHWMRTYLFYPIATSSLFLGMGEKIGAAKKEDKEYREDNIWGGSLAEHLGKVIPGCIATLITFLVVGIWHGSNWAYVGYGLYNGLVILFAMLLDPIFKWLMAKMHIQTESVGWHVWRIVRTFIVILGSFVFDSSDSLTGGLRMLGRCMTPILGPTTHLGNTPPNLGLESTDWFVILFGLLIVLAVSLYQEISKKHVREQLDKQTLWLQWALTLGCLFAIIIFGMYGPGVSSGEFVYMQF